MNPIEIMDEIERFRAFEENGVSRSLDACEDWQSLRAAIEAQAEELAQARARIGRLTDVLKTLRYPAPDKYREMIDKIINESEPQSLAAVRVKEES